MKGHQVQDNRVLPPICLSGVEKCFSLSGAVSLEQPGILWSLVRGETPAWLPGDNFYIFTLETPLPADPCASYKTFNLKLVSNKTRCPLHEAISEE